MLADFFAPGNLPFAVALIVMGGLTALEVLGTLLGMGLSQLIDSALPDFDLGLDADADVGVDLGADAGVDLHGGAAGARGNARGNGASYIERAL